ERSTGRVSGRGRGGGHRDGAQGSARSEDAGVSEIPHHRFTIGVQDLEKLTKITAGVDVNRDIQFLGGGAFSQQRRLAGFRLSRIENSLQPAVVRTGVLLDKFDSSLQARATPVFAFLVVVATLRIGENIVASVRRAKKQSPPHLVTHC